MDVKLNQQIGYVIYQERLQEAEQYHKAKRLADTNNPQPAPNRRFTPLRKAVQLVAALLH